MADWAVRPISPVRAKGDEEFFTVNVDTDGTPDFEQGAPAVLQGDGEVAETGVDPSDILGFFTASYDDYEWQEDTFGYVVRRVPVALADQEFRGTLGSSDTAGSAYAYTAASDFGTEYGLVEDSETGLWVVDGNETTNTRVIITGVDDDVEDGDTNVPVTFRVLAANRQVTG